MVATTSVSYAFQPVAATTDSSVVELAARLERGWHLIEDRRARGEPVDSYERHWLELLDEYERLVESQSLNDQF